MPEREPPDREEEPPEGGGAPRSARSAGRCIVLPMAAGIDTGIWLRTLAAKLRPPHAAARRLPRPRLSSAVGGSPSFRLALVSAPAGSGKTTVLADWHRILLERREAAAWLTLDDFDNQPRRFLADVVAAVQSVLPDFGRAAQSILDANPDPLMEDLAASLMHDLERARRPVTLFFDDYHEIRDRAIHSVVDYLLRFAPQEFRVVIGTRRDPPLSLGRLRLRGELLEVRWDALRFDEDETKRYLREVCRLPLTEDQALLLGRRIEGWAAGLQLAAMACPRREETDRFVAGFSGAQRGVADYLLESVFAKQPPAMRQFLLRTSILDRMTAPLCDALTGRNDGRSRIEALERANLFVFALDDRREWYRYHPLFAEFLRARLKAELPGEVAALYDRAGEWLERNGLVAEAVRSGISGGRFRRAARLIETAGRDLYRHGDFKQLRRWIEALPDRTVARSPALCVLHAWALAYTGEFEGARQRIARAEEAVQRADGAEASMRTVRAELQVVRAVLGIIRTDEPDVSGMHSGIVSLFPKEESALRAYASITLGFASRVAGYLPLALQHFREALVTSERADSSLVNLNARRNIGIANYLMGRMNDAEQGFRASLEICARRLWLRSIGAAFLRCGLALVLYEKNRLGEALEELSEAIACLEAGDAPGFLGMALVDRARAHVALGNFALASADLGRARDVARKHGVERVAFRADLLDAYRCVRAGDLDRAEELLASAEATFGGERFDDRAVFPERYEFFLVERLRLLLARGWFREAADGAARGLRSAEGAGRGRNAVEFQVLEAAAWNRLGDPGNAVARLADALGRAAAEGFVRPFINAGRDVAPLLRRFRDDAALGPAAAAILSAMEDRGGAPEGVSPAGPAAEPFHRREVQILRLISEGLRNREIGDRLFLSEETVKWYLKRLYCKLSVRTRTEAIAAARRQRLLA